MQQHNNGFSDREKNDKGNTRLTQKEKVLQYFQTHTATVRMCEQATGIPSHAICGYKAILVEDEELTELYKAPCKITGRKAWYYSASVANSMAPETKNNNPTTAAPVSIQWFLDSMDLPEKKQPKKPIL